ncbi:hypothetical protein TYRP_007947 [Tyrophagus putrescentiae]|nr:hypothetical protein TYRP_007947 [Tyrophagus putrescentiae]
MGREDEFVEIKVKTGFVLAAKCSLIVSVASAVTPTRCPTANVENCVEKTGAGQGAQWEGKHGVQCSGTVNTEGGQEDDEANDQSVDDDGMRHLSSRSSRSVSKLFIELTTTTTTTSRYGLVWIKGTTCDGTRYAQIAASAAVSRQRCHR